MNAFVKKAMLGRYTLINLFQEILKIEQRVIKASREIILTPHSVQVVNNPLMNEIRERFSQWAFEKMLY